MLKPVIDFGRQILGLTRNVEKAKADIVEARVDMKELRQDVSELRRELRDMAHAIEILALRQQSERDSAAKEYENLVLRLRIALGEHGRLLPPPEQ